MIKHLYSQSDVVYRLIPLVSELAKSHPDTGTIFVCIRHPTHCILKCIISPRSQSR